MPSSPQNASMLMPLNDEGGWNGQGGEFQNIPFPLPSYGGRSRHKHDIGLQLLKTSQHRIDLSLAAEHIHRTSLCRAMKAIHASVQRIGSSDKLIERIWTGQS
jgi:hypothetical protein